MRLYVSGSSLLIVSLFASISWACWKGYKEDSPKVNTVIYARSNYANKSFEIDRIRPSQKVCVSEKVDHGYVEIQYEDPSKPGIPKFGYIATANLKGVRTEAVSPYCASCMEEPEDSFFSKVEDTAEDVRTTAQKEAARKNAGLGSPLPYADRIMSNVKHGLALGNTGRPRDRKCARAVSRILRGADLLPGGIGAISTPGGFNGEDGFKFLSSHQFVDDKSACNRPGVVLIYGQAKPGYGKKPGQRGYLQGDRYGHAEILGTDGKYYFYGADDAPMSEILGPNRRPLLHCMVSRIGMKGGPL